MLKVQRIVQQCNKLKEKQCSVSKNILIHLDGLCRQASFTWESIPRVKSSNYFSIFYFSSTFKPTEFLFFLIFLFLDSGEGKEKERERNINVREKHQLVASPMHPNQETNPQPRCALTGNWTRDLSLCRTTANQLSHIGQGLSLVASFTVSTNYIYSRYYIYICIIIS